MENIPDHPVIRNMERTGNPYDYEPRHFCECDWCGSMIYVGDSYWNIHGEILCEKCMEDCRMEATK